MILNIKTPITNENMEIWKAITCDRVYSNISYEKVLKAIDKLDYMTEEIATGKILAILAMNGLKPEDQEDLGCMIWEIGFDAFLNPDLKLHDLIKLYVKRAFNHSLEDEKNAK